MKVDRVQREFFRQQVRKRNKLQISKYDQWAEPLTSGIQRVVSLNLAGRLDTEDVQSFPWAHDHAPRYGVRLNLLELDANDQLKFVICSRTENMTVFQIWFVWKLRIALRVAGPSMPPISPIS